MTHFAPRPTIVTLLLAVTTLLASAPTARAQTYVDEDNVPTGARRAAEWKPSPEGLNSDAWYFSASAGFCWFNGDDGVDGDAGFSLEARVARELSSDFYAVGSYLLAFAPTDVVDPTDGSDHTDTSVLNIPTIGIGYRWVIKPEIHLFIEPRLGAVFGGDVDIAPVGGAAAGVQIQLDPGIWVHATFTGLLTDATIETRHVDTDLDAIWSVGVGLTFEF
jgi:hypothetical protein